MAWFNDDEKYRIAPFEQFKNSLIQETVLKTISMQI